VGEGALRLEVLGEGALEVQVVEGAPSWGELGNELELEEVQVVEGALEAVLKCKRFVIFCLLALDRVVVVACLRYWSGANNCA